MPNERGGMPSGLGRESMRASLIESVSVQGLGLRFADSGI